MLACCIRFICMTWVKICGITNLEDARLAVDAGADALGFVFYEKSPRKVSVETARDIVAQLPERVEKVGVFVNDSLSSILAAVSIAKLTAVQLHANPQPGRLERLSTRAKLFVAVPAREIFLDESDFGIGWRDEEIKSIAGLLVDSSTPEQPGGTGRTFGWDKAAPMLGRLGKTFKVIVAGGLDPANVAQAIHILRPWGVDVASGTEAEPGKKDPEKVRAFVEAVQRADKAA